MIRIILALNIVGVGLSSFALNANPCTQILLRLSSANPSLSSAETRIIKYLEDNAEKTRVFLAARNVYMRKLAAGENLEFILSPSAWINKMGNAEDEFEKEWISSLSSRVTQAFKVVEAAVPLGGDKGGPDSVQKVIINKEHKVFRPLLSEEENPMAFMLPSKIRRTLGSANLNQLLDVATDAGGEVVKIGAHIGSLSAFIDGDPLTKPIPINSFDPIRYAEILVLEFIMGNRDQIVRNFIVPKNDSSNLISIDHDLAFSNNIPKFCAEMSIGTVLPDQYPKSLIERLKSLSLNDLTAALSADLTTYEIAQIKLRIDIVLEDYRLRFGSN